MLPDRSISLYVALGVSLAFYIFQLTSFLTSLPILSINYVSDQSCLKIMSEYPSLGE